MRYVNYFGNPPKIVSYTKILLYLLAYPFPAGEFTVALDVSNKRAEKEPRKVSIVLSKPTKNWPVNSKPSHWHILGKDHFDLGISAATETT